MKLIKKQIKINETRVNIHIYDDVSGLESPGDFAKLIKDSNEIGFAGFSKRNDLTKLLIFHSVGSVGKYNIDTKKIIKLVRGSLHKCLVPTPLKEIYVFVFPTKDNFIRDKMGGVSGDTFWKNTILLFLHSDSKLDSISRTVAHEFAHAYSLNYMERITLQDNIVFDGMAENFSISVIGGDETPWSTSLSREESMKIFRELKNKLHSTSRKLYGDLFFGREKYPLWSGYAIGYHLVCDYLKSKKVKWLELLKTSTEKVIKGSKWL